MARRLAILRWWRRHALGHRHDRRNTPFCLARQRLVPDLADSLLMSDATFDPSIQILLVDDDDVDVRVVTRGLSKHGLPNPLFVARDGLEALEQLRGEADLNTQVATLVLLDLRMPRMDGLEFLRELRQDPVLRRTLVVMLTTSDAPKDISGAYDLNVAGYLLKQGAGRNFENYVPLIQAYFRSVRFPPRE